MMTVIRADIGRTEGEGKACRASASNATVDNQVRHEKIHFVFWQLRHRHHDSSSRPG